MELSSVQVSEEVVNVVLDVILALNLVLYIVFNGEDPIPSSPINGGCVEETYVGISLT